jgi:uncharacterized cupin superfamily protein
MPKSIVMATAATADLDPAPIPSSWILQGTPEAAKKQFVRTEDRNSYIVAWECTPGRFTWHYSEDETLVVLSGEALITNENGEERRLAPGDLAFFPSGTSATWHVTRRIRKVAVVRHTVPLPLVFGLRVWNKLRRILRLTGGSPLMLNVIVTSVGML